MLSYEYPAQSNLVVNDVLWDEPNPTFPDEPIWKYALEDIDRSAEGEPGQNMRTPAEKVFAYHHLRRRLVAGPPEDKTYYDPSYGVTAKTRAAYTGKMIAGWGKRLTDDIVHYRKRGVGELVQFMLPNGEMEE